MKDMLFLGSSEYLTSVPGRKLAINQNLALLGEHCNYFSILEGYNYRKEVGSTVITSCF